MLIRNTQSLQKFLQSLKFVQKKNLSLMYDQLIEEGPQRLLCRLDITYPYIYVILKNIGGGNF